MKVLLIAPASGKWRGIGRAGRFGGRAFRFSLPSLLGVAAATPKGVDLEIVDEQIQTVCSEQRYDLVGISCMTAAAPRAYALAEKFRRRGTLVVLGGMHPTLLPDEALAHADAVCIGDAEGVWPRILADARNGTLRGVYRQAPRELRGLRRAPRRLLRRHDYGTLQTVQATRGCPNRCTFCSVSAFHRGLFRMRPVDEVTAEIAELPERFFIFTDDNLTADPGYAAELFEALRPLGKRWVTQSTLSIAGDPVLLRSASRAGCVGLFVGLETFTEDNLASVDKAFHKVDAYRESVAALHAHGIGVEAGIVFGFDRDDRGVFRRTLDLLDSWEIDMIQVSILTPLPGTPFNDKMESRIFDRDWEHYDFHHAVFEPMRMSAEELQAGHDWVTREFYRPYRIARRLARATARPGGLRWLPYAAMLDLAYYGRVKRWRIRGYDPDVPRKGQTRRAA